MTVNDMGILSFRLCMSFGSTNAMSLFGSICPQQVPLNIWFLGVSFLGDYGTLGHVA